MICSKCIVADHKGHRVSDMCDNKNVKMFQRRAQILKKKIDTSVGETEIFSEELQEIEEQLQVSFSGGLNFIFLVDQREYDF